MVSFKLGVGKIPVFLPNVSGVELWVEISPRRFDLCVLGDAAVLRHDQAISTKNMRQNQNAGENGVYERFSRCDASPRTQTEGIRAWHLGGEQYLTATGLCMRGKHCFTKEN
jgi:hypothetical protein